ncbi:hypothetical protein FRC12_022488 [Ceratobasidium sp. 428]|nr:hypothetical protein FRC12_022488 [Ceratobasidium sp. 428]
MRQKKPLKNVQKRVCWQGPATWVHILAAVKAEGIEYARKHPTAVVKRLRLTHRDTKLFDKLHESVVGRWFTTDDSGRACWQPTVLLRALKESGLGGGGRSKKLAQYPAVLEGAIQQLKALRRTNTPVSCAIARSIILAHLRIHAPQVQMTLSNQWIQRFMRDQLGWSYRTATKAARKRPSNWESQGLLMFLRMVKTIDQYQIRSPRMIVNADQTGISLLPTGNKTWETVGKDQVSSISHDEKRQVYALTKTFYPRLTLSKFTLVVASSCGGDFLPFQSVWGGKTEGSLPNKAAPRRAEADQLGFTFAHGDKRHWSSLSTTKSWVKETLIPYLKTVREEEGLPPEAAAILLVDAWPTHISKANPECFIPWMKKEHPEIKIHFVPAGCTGELQPADTLLQRVVKHIIKIASLDYFVACSTRQLQAGVAPEAVVLPNDLPSLRDASVAWTVEAFRYMQSHPEVVEKAWARCQTGEWNLTWDKLTSPAAKDLFYATLSTNEAFRNELGMSGPIVPRSRQEDEPGLDVPHDEAAEEFESSEDDVAIPVEQLVNVLTGENIPQGIRSAEDGGWTRFGDEDDIDLVSAEPGNELQGESDNEINAESDEEPGAQTDSPEGVDAACVDNDDQPNLSKATDATGNDAVDSINQERPFMDAPNAESVELTATTISSEALPGSTTAYNHGGEAHAESNAVQSTTPDAPAQEQSSEKNTTTAGNDTVTYAVDIAVLGGTHPAVYNDTSRILPTKRGRSGGKSKATDTDAAGGSQNVVHEEPMDQSQVNKRPRRSSRLSKEVDGVPNEPRKGRGRGRGRGRPRTTR